MLSTPDPSPKLMQLRQTKTLRVFNQHHASIRNIDTDLENSCADQRVCLTAPKALHDLLFFSRRNAAVKQFTPKRMKAFPPQLVLCCCRFHVYFFTFIDQRVNDVELATCFQLSAQECKNVRQVRSVKHSSHD